MVPNSDVAAASRLGEALSRADYTEDAIEELLGEDAWSSALEHARTHSRRLPRDPTGTAIRLFFLELPVPLEEAQRALGKRVVQALERTGLARTGAKVVPRARIAPVDGLLIASDRLSTDPTDDPPNYVSTYSPTARLCDLLTPRPRSKRALDVGTGNGIHALLAARHSRAAVATDVNPRALAFTELNAALSGLDNVECRRGSLFEPVEGERFDLVLCNPPYLISPDSLYAYRDSGMGGDTVSREAVRRAPDFLVEGGFAHLLVSWIRREDDEWTERLRDWTAESGCDALFLHYQTEKPIDHAESWLAPLAAGPVAEYEGALDRWLEYFERERIAAISHGAVMLRRRTAPTNWTRAEELPTNRLLPASVHVLRIVAAEDFLEGLARPEDLLDEQLALVEAHELDQRLAAREGGLGHVHTSLSLEEGLGFVIGIDLETAELLPALDGAASVRSALAARAEERGIDPDRLAAAALPVVRRLFELGFLERL